MYDQCTGATLHTRYLFLEASHTQAVRSMLSGLHWLASAAGSPLLVEQPWSQLCSQADQPLLDLTQRAAWDQVLATIGWHDMSMMANPNFPIHECS